jgi:hypothetical protein
MKKFPVLGSALVLALSGSFISIPAMAFTHHPSTAKERAQTRDLNEQSLAQAEGQAPTNQQAMNANGAQPAAQQPAPAQNAAPNASQAQTPATTPAPSADNGNMQAPPASSDSSTPQAQQPQPQPQPNSKGQ